MRCLGSVGLVVMLGCGGPQSDSEAQRTGVAPPAKPHPVELRRALGPNGLRTDRATTTGRPVDVPCGICHDGRNGGLATRNPGGSVVHSPIPSAHGTQPCLACHDAQDRGRLRLADGTALDFDDALELCAQCHGPQKRDYDHGAHGGMAGYWDLSRGPRSRNHCLVCHDPHAPAIPQVLPAPPPADAIAPPHA